MYRLHPMTLVQRFLLSLPALFVILLPALRNPDANAWFSIGSFLLYAVFVVPLIVVQYLRFRYAVTPKEIIIHKGVFTYQHRNIPIERIQNIEIEQRLLPRLFGTAKVKIETAGSSSTEGVIEFVGMAEARSIRSTVRTYQRERKEHAPEAGPAAAGMEARPFVEGAALESRRDVADSVPEPQEKLLHEMPVGRVVLSGAFRFSLLYIVVIFSATEYLGVTPEDMTRWFTGDRFEEVIGVMESSPWLVAVATILMVALLAWITGLVTNFNRFYGFRLSREEGKLHTRYGLLTVSEATIPLKKIQALVLRTNPLMSAFGWYRLELQTMGFDPDDRGYRTAAPFVRSDEAMAIAREIRPVEEPGELHRVSRLMIRRTFVRYAVVLVLAACGVGYFWTPALWALAALPLLLYVAVQQFRHHGFRFTEEYLYVRRGVFRETVWIIPLERFQVFYLSRSIFQRRLGLASVYVDTPGAGAMAHPVVVDLPAEEASTLMYGLYRRFQLALGSRRREARRLAGEEDFTICLPGDRSRCAYIDHCPVTNSIADGEASIAERPTTSRPRRKQREVQHSSMLTHLSKTAMPHQVEEPSGGADASPIQIPRSSGILLHVSSLPSRHGIGDLGKDAYRFADFLIETGQRIWQVLPLVPAGLGHSPYSSPSTFAVNPLFISPEGLAEERLLDEPLDVPEFPADSVDFEGVLSHKYDLLMRAFRRFEDGSSGIDRSEFDAFAAEHSYWLDDYALFTALKGSFDGRPWTEWPDELASRDAAALDRAREQHQAPIRQYKFWQFLAFRQWLRLKKYCNDRGLHLFGDLPIYVAHDSADVWANRELFFLDEGGRSTVVAGVPPDYFSETGQRWGNPIYRWDLMNRNGYTWWTHRFANILRQVDLIRLDHFRGFAGYWEIPSHEETAVRGRWVKGPGESLFRSVEGRFGPLPLVAENLGMITPDVTELMNTFGFPGMAVLQFAFGEDAGHPFLPHNLEENVVAYTGTHDNNTVTGWWEEMRHDREQTRSVRFAKHYLGLDGTGDDGIHWASVRVMMASPAKWVVIPLQDVLGLGASARMNTPGLSDGNWSWRFDWEQLTPAVRDRLGMLTAVYGRSDRLSQLIQTT